MNTIYCKVWNRALGQWVVASELARGDSAGVTGAQRRTLPHRHALVIALLAGGMAAGAQANTTIGSNSFVSPDGAICSAVGTPAPNAVAAWTCQVPNGSGGYAIISRINATATGAPDLTGLAGALGPNAVLIGTTTTQASADGAVAIGPGARATADTAIALGDRASATGTGAVAVGFSARAEDEFSVALGGGAVALGQSSYAMGNNAQARDFDVAIGAAALIGSTGSTQTTAVGYQAGANSTLVAQSTFVGFAAGAQSSGTSNAFVGSRAGAQSVGDFNVANGTFALAGANGDHNIAQGNGAGALVTGDDNVAIGRQAGTLTTFAADGTPAVLTPAAFSETVSIGSGAAGVANRAIAIGTQAAAAGGNAIALGTFAQALDQHSIALGSARSEGQYSIAAGIGAIARGSDTLALGTNALTGGFNAVAIGTGAQAEIDDAVALGSSAIADTAAGVAGYDPVTGLPSTDSSATWVSTLAAVSVGSAGNTRQITNVAAGTEDTDAVNVAQLQAAQTHYYSVNDNGVPGANYNNDGATGVSALAAGVGARAEGQADTAMGFDSQASGSNSIAIGTSARALQAHATAMGHSAEASGQSAVAIGFVAQAAGAGAIAIGHGASTTTANDVTVIGTFASATQNNAMALGTGASATGESALSIGTNARAVNADDIAIGRDALASGGDSLAIGGQATGLASTAIDGVAEGDSSTALGGRAVGAASLSIHDGLALGQNSNAIGTEVVARGNRSTVLGWVSEANGDQSLAIGAEAIADGVSSMAIGTGARANGENSISIGTGNVVNGDRSGAIGDPSIIDASDSYSVGNNNTLGAAANNSFVLGNNVSIDVDNATALGNGTSVTQSGGVALGSGSVASTAAGVAGYDPLTGLPSTDASATWTSTLAAVSVGSAGNTRQITNVAAGTEETDAVNVAQLQAAQAAATTHYYSVNDNGVIGGNYDNNGALGTNSLAAGVDTFAFGEGSTAVGSQNFAIRQYSTAVGHDNVALAVSSTAVGDSNQVWSDQSGAFGFNNRVGEIQPPPQPTPSRYSNSYAVGSGNVIEANNTFVLGNNATLNVDNATALGHATSVTQAGGVALGSGSIASTAAGVAGYDPRTGLPSTDTSPAWTSTLAAVSVGSAGNTRQITHVAAGTEDTDAVNVAQLRAVSTAVDAGWNATDAAGNTANIGPNGTVTFESGNTNIAVSQTGADDDGVVDITLSNNLDLTSAGSVTTGDTLVNNAGVAVGTNVALGSGGLTVIGGATTTVVNGDGLTSGLVALSGVSNDITGLSNTTLTDPTFATAGRAATEEQLQLVEQSANAGWNATDAAGNTANIGPGGTVTFEGDANIAVSQTGTNDDGVVAITLNRDLDVDSVTAGDTLLDTDGLTITGGPSVTITGINAGGTVITNVAAGVAPTDAVNVSQLTTVETAANAGWNATDAAGSTANIGPDGTVTFESGNTNIAVSQTGADDDGVVDITLSNNLDLTAAGSVTTGDTLVNNAGVAVGTNVALGSGGLTVIGGTTTTIVNGTGVSSGNVVLSGVNNDITGLSNRTLIDPTFATAGRAATEEQLRLVRNEITSGFTPPTRYYGVNSLGGGNQLGEGATGEDAMALGKDAESEGQEAVAMGRGARATEDDSMALGAGSQALSLNALAIGAGAVASHENSIALGAGSATTVGARSGYQGAYVGSSSSTGELNIGGRQLTGVAAGSAATDAVNVSQLQGGVTYAITEANTYTDARIATIEGDLVDIRGDITDIQGDIVRIEGDITNLDTRVGDVEGDVASLTTTVNQFDNRVTNLERGGSGPFQVTQGETYLAPAPTGANASAGGNGAVASGDNSTAVGNQSVASGDNSTAIGQGAVASHDNSVALGRGSATTVGAQRDYNAAYVGTSTSTGEVNIGGRTISGVAPGIAGTDAVNVNQLDAGVDYAINQANAYTDTRFNQFEGDMWNLERGYRGGTASAMAMAGLPQAYLPGKSMLSVAFGGYQGEYGMAFGLSTITDNGRWVYKAQATGNTTRDWGFSVGAGLQW